MFPPSLGSQDNLVFLKSTLTETTFPDSQDQPAEMMESLTIDDLLPPSQANPDEDLIALLKSESTVVRYQTASAGPSVSPVPSRSKERWRTVRMKVTGYCACSKCCGTEDGITANNHRIVNGDRFVAADKFYGFGTEMVIPGYNADRPVKVMDRGKAIKGNRIDLFFHSHAQAKKWGVKYLEVRVKIK